MKTKILLLIPAFILAAVVLHAQKVYTGDQVPKTQEDWQQAKQSGKLDGKGIYMVKRNDTAAVQYRIVNGGPVPHPASNVCSCWQQRDSSWSICQFNGSGGNGGPGVPPLYRNDDWTTPLVSLPFNFCLYGTNWNSVYINNNGNVSFGAPYSTFTALGFPNASFVMVAPIWCDVDTRNATSGLVYYKITPTYMVVQWDSVGYFNIHADKTNTFQLIITDGSDPIVPGGNVSFCYKDMQWTTGDASGGVNGFGGSDAVVGANKGDGINYVQFGEFSQPGSTYNGPNTPGSGIDWLDNQSIIFNACTTTNNIPPTPNGISFCDTLTVCIGDTLFLNPTFFSPEVNQITNIWVDTTGVSGYHVVSNVSGNTAVLNSYLVAQASNAGYNLVTIIAADNGVPPDTTYIPLIIHVLPPLNSTISNDTTICLGGQAQLAAGGGTIYSWSPTTTLSNGTISNPVATPTVTTTYTVDVSNGACDETKTVTVTIQNALVNAGPDTAICIGSSVHLHSGGCVTYHWSPGSSLSDSTIANPTATPTVTTTYTVTGVDNLGCTAQQTITVVVNALPSPAFSYSPNVIFLDSTYAFTDLSTGNVVGWLWYFGDGDTSHAQNPVHFYSDAGTYHVCLVTTNNLGCVDSTCTDVQVLPRDIIAPNVFTPNGDGTNDVLVFQYLEYYPGCSLLIYDRWGVKVYESDNYQNNWNGKKFGSGKDCVDGVYYYVLTGPKLKKAYTGFVELLRGK